MDIGLAGISVTNWLESSLSQSEFLSEFEFEDNDSRNEADEHLFLVGNTEFISNPASVSGVDLRHDELLDLGLAALEVAALKLSAKPNFGVPTSSFSPGLFLPIFTDGHK